QYLQIQATEVFKTYGFYLILYFPILLLINHIRFWFRSSWVGCDSDGMEKRASLFVVFEWL
ncbi:unnamed protein product, partial [Brassica oleracea var. botrytis]